MTRGGLGWPQYLSNDNWFLLPVHWQSLPLSHSFAFLCWLTLPNHSYKYIYVTGEQRNVAMGIIYVLQTNKTMLLSDRDVAISRIIKKEDIIFIINTNGHKCKTRQFLMYQKFFLNVISLVLKRLVSYKFSIKFRHNFIISWNTRGLKWCVQIYRAKLWLEVFKFTFDNFKSLVMWSWFSEQSYHSLVIYSFYQRSISSEKLFFKLHPSQISKHSTKI